MSIGLVLKVGYGFIFLDAKLKKKKERKQKPTDYYKKKKKDSL